MAELVVFSTESDGEVYKWDADYATAHDTPDGSIFENTVLDVYNYLFGAEYRIARSLLFFDTSPLGAGATILSVVLSLYIHIGATEDDPGQMTLHIVEGVQHDPIVAADYGAQLSKVTSGGSIVHGDVVFNEYNDITLNATGLSWINKTGTTLLCLRASGDINEDVPTGVNRLGMYASEQGEGFKPKLTIEYEEAVAARGSGSLAGVLELLT